MRQFAHFITIFIAAILWAFGCIGYALAFLFTYIADKLQPNTKYGNCWSYVGPKWVKHGGYLFVRPADGQRFLKWLPVLHVGWVKNLDPRCVEIEQYAPIERKQGRFMPWHVFYYKGEIKRTETPHPSKMTDWMNM